MISVKPGKDWKKVLRLMEHYSKRLKWSQERIVRDIAEAFLEILKDKVPESDLGKEFTESLKVVRLTGVRGANGYAVVSERDTVKLEELTRKTSKPTVVYVEQKKGRGDMDPAVALMVLNNPWPPAMIPANLSTRHVRLVHMAVSQEEFNWAVKNAQKYIQANQVEFAKAKARFRPERASDADEEVSGLESMPDYMSFALRSEFGINIRKQSQWRPAIKDLGGKIAEIIKDDKEVQKALYDSLFTKHLGTKPAYKDEMPEVEFQKEAGEFQKRIAAVSGA